jgi:hypothetical protein
MYSKEEAYSQISALVERFSEQLPSYKKSDYNETQTRLEFINPFFKALGWDVDNSQGNAHAYREVIHEDKIKIGSATKAPDYSFRLPGGKRLFFVEAKKPSVFVKDEVLPAYQVRRYAWSAKLPISILTDFEEFAVYDCKKKPNITDKASTSRIKYLTYKDYVPEFDFIWDNFSKEKVLKGGFDKYVQSDSNKKGTSTVDKEFLVSLDEWRKQLAQNIALRNSNLNEDEINYTVQQTLDRLIFLRIAEDRGVEEYGRLKSYLDGAEYYQNLFQYFKEADSKYNSGLFNFKKDTLSAALVLDNKVIKNILNELYYPISPYEFSVLSVEILGSAYEQFLGKQIRLTAGHKAVIEEKPEVRKAGGVYYTPQYIVDYIVENTVGKLTEKKTPEEIAKLKIVDPACGSGSFLIGAYQYLLNWHQQYYKPKFDELTAIAASNEHTTKQRTDAQKERNHLPLTPDGNLTTAVKKQILTNNIFGVDIDAQAVEVTKLSLMLKCMEGETKSSLAAQMQFGERVLPTLDDNIKSGNSLIDMDFYEGKLDFEPGIEKKVKPFSWTNAFPIIFKEGGFDCVVGNPPYVRNRDIEDISKEYFNKKYFSADGQYDLYQLFYEKSIVISSTKGLIGFITSNKFTVANYGFKLRQYILDLTTIKKIVDVSNMPVFKDASTYPYIIILEKSKASNVHLIKVKKITDEKEIFFNNYETIKQADFNTSERKNFILKNEPEFIKRVLLECFKLGDIATIKETIHTGNIRSKLIVDNKVNENCFPVIGGREVSRYLIDWEGRYVNYDPMLIDKKNGEYANLCEKKYFEKPKILMRDIARELIAVYDEQKFYSVNTLYSVQFKEPKFSLKALLGILNSKFVTYFFKQRFEEAHVSGGYLRFKKVYTSQIPIPKSVVSNKAQKILIAELVQLVETMLQLQKEKQQTNLPDKLNQLEARIKYTDDKINQLVFELYGLSEEERGIVEGVA